MASNQAGSSHSTKKAAISTTPMPARPKRLAIIDTTSTTAARSRKSTDQASARGTGPASRSVSSIPSGVATRRVVSSKPPPYKKIFFLTPTHRVEELGVRFGGFELVDEEFGGLELVHREQQLPQHPDLLQDGLLDEELLAANSSSTSSKPPNRTPSSSTRCVG